MIEYRPATKNDIEDILNLYKAVAETPGGLLRLANEIDINYIHGFIPKSCAKNLEFVAVEDSGEIVGEIHVLAPTLASFAHVLSDLTIAVSPSHQGSGIGRSLFQKLLKTIEQDHPHILRVELVARESNHKAIRFYQSLGFRQEGEFVSRIRNVDGSLESDIPMAWLRS